MNDGQLTHHLQLENIRYISSAGKNVLFFSRFFLKCAKRTTSSLKMTSLCQHLSGGLDKMLVCCAQLKLRHPVANRVGSHVVTLYSFQISLARGKTALNEERAVSVSSFLPRERHHATDNEHAGKKSAYCCAHADTTRVMPCSPANQTTLHTCSVKIRQG